MRRGKFKPIGKPALSKEVETQIRASINAGIYKPGDKLPSERELVEQFKVSRVTVRDGLKNLQSFGLITIKRGMNAGAYVSDPSPRPIIQSIDNLIQMKKASFAHLIETRLYIEPNVAGVAAAQRTPDDVTTLSRLLDQAEKALRRSRKEARLINVRFHLEVCRITNNALLVFLSESITQVFSAMIIEKTGTKLSKEEIHKLIEDHRSILQAIDDGDSTMASELTKAHLIKTYYTYAKILPHARSDSVGERIKHLEKSSMYQSGVNIAG